MNNSLKEFGISIVIPNWNGLHLLKQSLDPLLKATKHFEGKSEIIVIDNGSQDRSVDVLKDYYPEVKLIAYETNTGFGHACNSGAQIAQYESILFLNNDIYVPHDFLSQLAQAFLEHPDCFSVSPQTNYWRGKELTNEVFSSYINFRFNQDGEIIQHWGVNNLTNLSNRDEPTIYGTGAALLVDKRKFFELGSFDPIFGLAYWEDVALCLNAWGKGWKSYYTNRTVAWHKISASAEQAPNDFKENLVILNYVIFHLIYISNLSMTLKFSKTLLHFLLNTPKKPLRNRIIKELLFKAPQIIKRRMDLTFSCKMNIFEIMSIPPLHHEGYTSKPFFSKGI